MSRRMSTTLGPGLDAPLTISLSTDYNCPDVSAAPQTVPRLQPHRPRGVEHVGIRALPAAERPELHELLRRECVGELHAGVLEPVWIAVGAAGRALGHFVLRRRLAARGCRGARAIAGARCDSRLHLSDLHDRTRDRDVSRVGFVLSAPHRVSLLRDDVYRRDCDFHTVGERVEYPRRGAACPRGG